MLFLCIFIVIVHVNRCTSLETIEVLTKSGPLVGFVDNYDGAEVVKFLGIPYAEPPIGKLRFQKSIPAKPWYKPLDATKIPDSCPQPRLSLLPETIYRKMSEDCLYLNIIISKKALFDKTRPKSVIFFLHPDDNLVGSANDYPYSLPILSLMTDVILVSANYRLGPFGFIYSDKTPGLEGNNGLWDQNLALIWVQENIMSFNGNPKSVTAVGDRLQSADIANHILSPESVGLFQNAILMGASPFYGVQDQTTLRTKLSSEILIERVECNKAKDVLKCLQEVPVSKLIDSITDRTIPFSFIYGDKYLPFTMEDIIQSKVKTNNKVNVLIGFTANSASLFLGLSSPYVFANAKLTLEDAKKNFESVVKKEAIPELMKIYIGRARSTYEIQQAILDFADDFVRCPIYSFANLLTMLNVGNVYTYIINHRPTISRWVQCQENPAFGVCDTDDLQFLFGVPFDRSYEYTNADRDYSTKIINIWSNFAKTGVAKTEIDWPNWKKKQASVVLNVYGDTLIDKYAKRCEAVTPFTDKESLPKLFPSDRYTTKIQNEVDSKTSFAGFLYQQLSTLFHNNMI